MFTLSYLAPDCLGKSNTVGMNLPSPYVISSPWADAYKQLSTFLFFPLKNTEN